MNFAICDDEKVMQDILIEFIKKYIKSKNIDVKFYRFSCGEELLQSTVFFDIIFMDYQIGMVNGIEISRKIRKSNALSTIIFVSAFTDVAIDSFEVKTFRFLKKPIDELKLFKALDDYFKMQEKDSLCIFKSNGETFKTKFSQIIYAEADKKNTIIKTLDEKFVLNISLKEVEKLLGDKDFFRCHKSFITSFRHIKSHTNKEIYFENGDIIYIGKAFYQNFKSAFLDYVVKYNLKGM